MTSSRGPDPSSQDARKRMRRTGQRDTAPEMRLRSALHLLGLRYRLQVAPVPGLRRRADIAFPRQRVAVFVDGCFWHSCPEHGTTPKANRAWWETKLRANAARDEDTNSRLRAAGWEPVRIWEHQDVVDAASLIQSLVAARQPFMGAAS
jgi:DNA mismatch endonuclease, patch repair protein